MPHMMVELTPSTNQDSFTEGLPPRSVAYHCYSFLKARSYLTEYAIHNPTQQAAQHQEAGVGRAAHMSACHHDRARTRWLVS